MSDCWRNVQFDIANAIDPDKVKALFDFERNQFNQHYINSVPSISLYNLVVNNQIVTTQVRLKGKHLFYDNWIGTDDRLPNSENRIIRIYQRNKLGKVIHVDNPAFTAAINWVVGDDNSTMQWWSLKKDCVGDHFSNVYHSEANTNVSSTNNYDNVVDQVIDQCVVGTNTTLVRVDIPHNVVRINDKTEQRLCFSMIANNSRGEKWEKIVERWQ